MGREKMCVVLFLLKGVLSDFVVGVGVVGNGDAGNGRDVRGEIGGAFS